MISASDVRCLSPLRFDTALLPVEMRFPAWKSALSSLDVTYSGTTPFAGGAALWLLESMVLIHATVDPLRYDRDEDRVRADIKDHIAVVVMLDGQFVGDYGYGEVVSPPGSLTVLDMRRACWTDATRLEAFILSLPRAFLIPKLEDCDPHGMVVSGGFADLLSGFLRIAVEALPTIPRDQALTVAHRIRDLLVDALLDACRGQAQRPARDDALISRVRAYIDAHLDAPLEVATICAALGISRSKLYRAFGGGGGVQQQVQRRRLHALRMALADTGETRAIADLATTFGFSDKSHLTRAFKREYGCTPGEFRAGGARQDHAVPVDQILLVFEQWTTLLD